MLAETEVLRSEQCLCCETERTDGRKREGAYSCCMLSAPVEPPPLLHAGARTGLPWCWRAAQLRLPLAASGQQCALTRPQAQLSQQPCLPRAAPQHWPALQLWWQPLQRRLHEQLPARWQLERAPDTAAGAGRRLLQLRGGKFAAPSRRSAAAARVPPPPAAVQQRQAQPGPQWHRRLHPLLPEDHRRPVVPPPTAYCANACNGYCSNRGQGCKA